MAPKKKISTRKSKTELPGKIAKTPAHTNGHGAKQLNGNGHNGNGHNGNGLHAAHISTQSGFHNGTQAITLRAQTASALDIYFNNLDGHTPGELYNLVMSQVEEPLFRAVLGYVDGNQSRAAEVLGINRGTLRKKLREYGLHDA